MSVQTGNLSELVRGAAERTPDKAAFVAGPTSVTWSEVDAQVDAAAAALAGLGLVPGDRVAISLANTLDFPVAPRGYRVLGRIPRIPKLVVQKIIHELGGLEEVLAASDADLEAVDDVGATRAKDIREGLRRLQEINLVDRYLQT